jgi:hypothetical protein
MVHIFVSKLLLGWHLMLSALDALITCVGLELGMKDRELNEKAVEVWEKYGCRALLKTTIYSELVVLKKVINSKYFKVISRYRSRMYLYVLLSNTLVLVSTLTKISSLKLEILFLKLFSSFFTYLIYYQESVNTVIRKYIKWKKVFV